MEQYFVYFKTKSIKDKKLYFTKVFNTLEDAENYKKELEEKGFDGEKVIKVSIIKGEY